MKVFTRRISLETGRRRELINITKEVRRVVAESGIRDGLCTVYTMHSTSSVIVNEDESGLKSDVIAKIGEDFPRDRGWAHNRIDDNADSHLAGAYLGPSVSIPVEGGQPDLGTWQSVFFLELDGPRSGRKVVIQVMGE
ncbi:MAG: secondary thiamine-phosphate synthase enzyme YjbQ [Candidatus Verstraetearchaeota archaeon]|nr:secondary thiamine-phosphate synthase enzyme YjbQ [Candidatus Verstraetearchaeota archaeon]